MGFLGILEDKHLSHVPATVVLNEEVAHSEKETSNLKHGTGKEAHLILVPQPSDDPNDPLNWSKTKKLVLITIVSFGGIIMAGVYSALLNPALGVMANDLDRTINDMAVLAGYTLLTAGAAGFLVAACARKWGRRPVFFFSSLLGIVGSIIGSCVLTYRGVLAARILQGIATSTYESILVAVIGDLYFVHQRGVYMGIIQFILGGVSNLAGGVCGAVTTGLGWPWLFRLCVIFSCIQTILVFLFVPETSYNRSSSNGSTPPAVVHQEEPGDKQAEDAWDHLEIAKKPAEPRPAGDMVKPAPSRPNIPPKKTYAQELALFNGTFCNENLIQLFIAPFAVCLNIGILFSVVVSGGMTALYVSQAMCLAQIFQAPPYNLSAAGVGYLSLGPFIGATIGSIIMSLINDPIIKWCARENKGVYEPEYRLLPGIGGLLVGVGLMGFGALAQKGETYYATATMHGITLAGVITIVVAVSGYALDAFHEMNDEIFIAMIIFKNFLFYGFSWFVNSWIARSGPSHVFYVLGGIGFAMTLTVPFMFIFGKRYRSYWARHNLLKELNIKTHYH